MKTQLQLITAVIVAAVTFLAAIYVAKDLSIEELTSRAIHRRAVEAVNWVPTGGRPFELLFRLYGSKKELFEKKWQLPDVERMK